eukprot:7145420-Ditylum_brightwellii.AAC.1
MVGKLTKDTRAMLHTKTSNTTRETKTMIAFLKIDLMNELKQSSTGNSKSQSNKMNAVSTIAKKANGATQS